MYIVGEEERDAVRRVIESGSLYRYACESNESAQFESEWSEKIGCPHTLAMNSGTSALICGLVGLGVGPGDEVVVPSYTFMATALAVLAVGAVPVLGEIDDSLTLDPLDLARKLTSRTQAIIPVHMCGLSCAMDALLAVADRHGIPLLEDACQAAGGSYKGKRLGSIGRAGAFSFNQYKIITCGEGGALVTGDRAVYEQAMIYHDGGCVGWDHDVELRGRVFGGVNYRIGEMQSAFLRVQVRRLDGILDALRTEKRLLQNRLPAGHGFVFPQCHDPIGDCGTTCPLLFEDSERAQRFARRAKELGLFIRTPLSGGRHVYLNWEPVLHMYGANHPGRDASRLSTAARFEDMCPQSLGVLGRTVLLLTSPTRSASEFDEFLGSVTTALRDI